MSLVSQSESIWLFSTITLFRMSLIDLIVEYLSFPNSICFLFMDKIKIAALMIIAKVSLSFSFLLVLRVLLSISIMHDSLTRQFLIVPEILYSSTLTCMGIFGTKEQSSANLLLEASSLASSINKYCNFAKAFITCSSIEGLGFLIVLNRASTPA